MLKPEMRTVTCGRCGAVLCKQTRGALIFGRARIRHGVELECIRCRQTYRHAPLAVRASSERQAPVPERGT